MSWAICCGIYLTYPSQGPSALPLQQQRKAAQCRLCDGYSTDPPPAWVQGEEKYGHLLPWA
eukprot:8815573-Prorocentrum_lima.AAC.1